MSRWGVGWQGSPAAEQETMDARRPGPRVWQTPVPASSPVLGSAPVRPVAFAALHEMEPEQVLFRRGCQDANLAWTRRERRDVAWQVSPARERGPRGTARSGQRVWQAVAPASRGAVHSAAWNMALGRNHRTKVFHRRLRFCRSSRLAGLLGRLVSLRLLWRGALLRFGQRGVGVIGRRIASGRGLRGLLIARSRTASAPPDGDPPLGLLESSEFGVLGLNGLVVRFGADSSYVSCSLSAAPPASPLPPAKFPEAWPVELKGPGVGEGVGEAVGDGVGDGVELGGPLVPLWAGAELEGLGVGFRKGLSCRSTGVVGAHPGIQFVHDLVRPPGGLFGRQCSKCLDRRLRPIPPKVSERCGTARNSRPLVSCHVFRNRKLKWVV